MASSTVTNAKYLDYAGLSTLVGNIKTLVDNKIIATKQVLGGQLGKGLTATEVQIGLHTPSGFTVAGADITELSTISIPGATASYAGSMTAADKTKLDGIAAKAEVNQNAFSTVNANGTSLSANSKTATLTIIQGSGISITASSNGRAFSIANTYSYTHPDYATSSTSSTSALSSGSKFTTLTGLEYHDDGHLKTIISKEFELPKLINDIKFAAQTASVPVANTVNVVYSFVNDTGIAGQSTASIHYNTIQVPTQKYVDSAIADKIAEADALIYKGIKTATTGNKIILETDAKVGYLYKVAATGNVCIKGTTANGVHVEPGDMIIANKDNPTALTDWDVIERNIDGAVSGPASSTDGNIAVFNGTTGKLIKDGGKKISDLATSGHTHNITANGSGDSEITVNKSNGNLAVTYNISHATHMTAVFTSNTATATADTWGESVTVKVPKLTVNTYGHVTAAEELEYNITIPAKPTHPALSLETYWGTEADSKDSYDPDESAKTWKIYKGVKSISAGNNIGVSTADGVATITCSYTYSLPLATSTKRGGIKIGYTSTGQNYAVQLSSEQAFVYVPWENNKVQSTTVSGGTHYLLGSSSSSNETAYTYKRNNVYITDDEVLSCAPSTVISNTASKVITHSDAITTAMIDALFA